MHEPSEDELDRWMGRLAQGEREAFDPLFRALHPRALRFARARLGDDQADDAAQSALERVFSRASEFEPGRPVLPWFYAVIANEVRAVNRANRAAAPEDPWEAAPEDTERQLVEHELSQALERALISLDVPSAEVIGAILGRNTRPDLSSVAFRKRVSRAYVRLRLLLGGYYEE